MSNAPDFVSRNEIVTFTDQDLGSALKRATEFIRRRNLGPEVISNIEVTRSEALDEVHVSFPTGNFTPQIL